MVALATRTAASRIAELQATSPVSACATWAASDANAGRASAGVARPCLMALSREHDWPALVRGPVLRRAFLWLATRFLDDVIAGHRWV